MKALRKRAIWILLALFLLPVLLFGIWYGRQVRQQNLDNALIEAIKKEDTRKAIALLDDGADANAVDKPYTPLTLQFLWTNFWNKMDKIEDTEVYESALQLAIPSSDTVQGQSSQFLQERPELVKTLLEHGANPNVADKEGYTPLIWSCESSEGDADSIVRLLVEHGADVNATNESGCSALMMTVIVRPSSPPDDIETVNFLLTHGAKVTCVDAGGHTVLDFARAFEKKYLTSLLEAALRKEQTERNRAGEGSK